MLAGDYFVLPEREALADALASGRHSECRVITFDPALLVEAITRSSGRIDSDAKRRNYVLSGPFGSSDKLSAACPTYAAVEVRYSPTRFPDIVIVGRIAAHILSERQGRVDTHMPTVIRELTAVAALGAIFDGMGSSDCAGSNGANHNLRSAVARCARRTLCASQRADTRGGGSQARPVCPHHPAPHQRGLRAARRSRRIPSRHQAARRGWL